MIVLVAVFAMNASAAAVYVLNNTVEFQTGENPEIRDGHYYYQQDVYWLDNGGWTMNLGTFPNSDGSNSAQDNDFNWSVDVTGDITIPEGYYDTHSGSHYELKKGDRYGSHIYFDVPSGGSGTIMVTATNPDHDGLPYSCTYTILYHMGSSSVKWDFNSAQYTLQGSWDGNESDLGSGTKYHKYNGALNYADGASVVSEAAGLRFTADNGRFGGNNPSGTSPVENRFVCLGQGASVTIPASLFRSYANPRVRIKANRYGGDNHCCLNITNAKDALGKNINSEYQLGGSAWWGDKNDNNYRGEYHFIIADKNQDFTIQVKNWNEWLMLLSLELYDSDEIITENSILGTTYQLLNNAGGSAASATFNLHYRGRAEKTRVESATISTTGTVTCNSGNLTNMGGNAETHTYTSNVGEFGTFRFRIDCYDHSGTYCTDYAWRTMSVGYMESRSYPYTWDFTDVQDYYAAGMAQEDAYTASGSGVISNNSSYNPVKRSLWDNTSGDYGLQVGADQGTNVHFCGGSQLWYGNQLIPELRYLGFTPVNFDRAYNGALSITADGLKFNQEIRDWWGWRITVPNVPTDGVVYVRAHKDRTDNFCSVAYYYGNNVNNKTEKQWFSTDATSSTAKEIAVTADESGDVIYVVPAPSSQQNVTLFFTGVTVRKIAVSVDPKQLSANGWATESRDRVIDPELTGYMTGKPFENLVVTSVDFGGKVVGLQAMGETDLMPLSAGADNNAYIIHNTDNEAVSILNGGFHLFVPDIHDYVVGNENFNKKALFGMPATMKAQLTAGTVARDENGMRNFVLSNVVYPMDEEGNIIGPRKGGDEGFYQVKKGGIQSNGNQGYLPVDINAGGNAPVYTLMFVGGEETTAIDPTTFIMMPTANQGEYYNLNGQKMDGVPTQRGIYITGGKKVFIK